VHSRGMIHRDLKPENLLIDDSIDKPEGTLFNVKLCDYGISKIMSAGAGGSLPKTRCGTEMFSAPEVLDAEVLNQTYGKSADVWSTGVVVYVMRCGVYPFENSTQIRSGILTDFPHDRSVSSDAKDFVRKLLRVDPTQRLTIKECLKHHWVTGKPAPDSQDSMMLAEPAEDLTSKEERPSKRFRVTFPKRIPQVPAEEQVNNHADKPSEHIGKLSQDVGQKTGWQPKVPESCKALSAIFDFDQEMKACESLAMRAGRNRSCSPDGRGRSRSRTPRRKPFQRAIKTLNSQVTFLRGIL